MALSKDKKKQVIEKLEKSIGEQKIMLFAGISKIKTKDLLGLKKTLKEKGNVLSVAKKTLFGIAAKNKGVEIDARKIEGEMAVIFGNVDEVSGAGIINKFSKTNDNLKILGGFFENQLIGPDKVLMLAQIPPKQELLAKMVRSFNAPISNFVGALSGNLRNLVGVLDAISKK